MSILKTRNGKYVSDDLILPSSSCAQVTNSRLNVGHKCRMMSALQSKHERKKSPGMAFNAML